jgi:hypothetical protein
MTCTLRNAAAATSRAVHFQVGQRQKKDRRVLEMRGFLIKMTGIADETAVSVPWMTSIGS